MILNVSIGNTDVTLQTDENFKDFFKQRRLYTELRKVISVLGQIRAGRTQRQENQLNYLNNPDFKDK